MSDVGLHPPRPGRGLALRALLAATAIVAAVAAAVVGLGVHAVGSLVPHAPALRAPTTDARPGAPQTVMVFGTDGRRGADAGAGARADTLLLVRLDARARAIRVMSLPRDLRVRIPGQAAPQKLNAAFALGGAGLATRTVTRLLSAPDAPFEVNHVVQVGFSGFRALVDDVGCVWTDVDRRYFNDVGGPGGYAAIDLQPGYQRLCGADALAYARYRHGDSDLVRAARQQELLRELLRQPGAQRELRFANRERLARLADAHTRTDRRLREVGPLLRLVKLGLAVAPYPVVQVPFGAGRLRDDGGDLVAPRSAVRASVRRLLGPAPAARRPRARRPARRSRPARSWRATPGMRDAAAEGRAQAAALGGGALRVAAPTRLPATARDVGPARRYTARAGGRPRAFFRLVADLGGTGTFLGVQGTTWPDPPILSGRHATVTVAGRRLLVFRDGRAVRLVAWRTRGAVYWVSNSLQRTVPAAQMLATARSFARSP